MAVSFRWTELSLLATRREEQPVRIRERQIDLTNGDDLYILSMSAPLEIIERVIIERVKTGWTV